MADVLFKEGTNEKYSSITPDEYTFYKIQDSSAEDPDAYLGTVKLSNQVDIDKLFTELEELEKRVSALEPTPFNLFDSYSCKEVANIVQSGQAENLWSVGDTTNLITLNGTVSTCEFDSYQCKAVLIGFDHNMDLETGGKHSITLHFGQNENGVNICFRDPNYDGGNSSTQTGFRMNASNTNVGGWESSWMRNDICPQFLELLPTDLQNVIGTTTKYTDNVGGATGNVESNVTATQDKVFLLSYPEVGLTSIYANSYEADYTEPYSEIYNSSNARIKYKHFDTSSASAWWGRSPYQSSSSNFCIVNTSGYSSNTSAGDSYGFAPAIVIF